MTTRREIYAGVFLISLATLMYEILLTRLFSVTMWHHFAFMAVSLAMFGTAVGAGTVFLAPRFFGARRASFHMGASCLLFAAATVGCFLIQTGVRFVPEVSWASLDSLVFIYVIAAIPFLFSGVCITLALTRFPARVGALYAADLLGAGLGCVVLGVVIGVTDAVTTAFAVALIGAVASCCFLVRERRPKALGFACLACLGLGGFVVANGIRVLDQDPLIRLRWVKGERESPPLYEKWNSFSRITVTGDPTAPSLLHAWGLSPAFRGSRIGRQLVLTNDAGGGTFLMGFDGDLDKLRFLRYDIASIAHYLRPQSRVLVVGAGGGRDVLAALAFGQPSVTAVEINGNVIDAVNGPFGAFTGHLDRQPGVRFVAEDARSFAARQSDSYGILQFSFVDTYAGTAAGAFALTENSLYTTQAWGVFLGSLDPSGILSVTRYYFSDLPAEFYRLFALAAAALRERGAPTPGDHIVVLRHLRKVRSRPLSPGAPRYDIGTLLVSPSPLSPADLDRIEQLASGLGWQIVYGPRSWLDPEFAEIAAADRLDDLTSSHGLDIAPPTDDRPFVNNFLGPGDLMNEALIGRGNLDSNRRALFMLGSLLVVVVVLSLAFTIGPLIVASPGTAPGAWPHLLFFGAIGLGFMLVEISQMQRLTVFLGHPTYGLSVVLFTLLLSGGAGSWLTQRIGPDRFAQLAPRRLLTLLVVLVATGWVTLPALRFCTDQTTPVRIGVAAALLCPAGIFMGMAFPLGMRQAVERTRHLAPWLLGINGAMSVCASVLAAAISLVYGISATFWLGVAAYAGAVFAFLIAPSAAASGPPGRLPPAAAPGATCSETESARLSRAG